MHVAVVVCAAAVCAVVAASMLVGQHAPVVMDALLPANLDAALLEPINGLPLSLSPAGRRHSHSTMLTSLASGASSLGSTREAQVAEDDDAEQAQPDRAEEEEREKQGLERDKARAESSGTGNDEDAEGSPRADEADAAGRGADDGYVHDIDVPERHSLATAAVPGQRGRDSRVMKTAVTTSAPPGAVTITPYDATQTLELPRSDWHQGTCRQITGHSLDDLRHTTGPSCSSYQALTDFKFGHCGNGRHRPEWRCSHNGHAIQGGSHFYRTSCQHERWLNTEYLERQTVRCPEGQVLSWFKYTSSGCWWHEARYEFRCRDAETTPAVCPSLFSLFFSFLFFSFLLCSALLFSSVLSSSLLVSSLLSSPLLFSSRLVSPLLPTSLLFSSLLSSPRLSPSRLVSSLLFSSLLVTVQVTLNSKPYSLKPNP